MNIINTKSDPKSDKSDKSELSDPKSELSDKICAEQVPWTSPWPRL